MAEPPLQSAYFLCHMKAQSLITLFYYSFNTLSQLKKNNACLNLCQVPGDARRTKSICASAF